MFNNFEAIKEKVDYYLRSNQGHTFVTRIMDMALSHVLPHIIYGFDCNYSYFAVIDKETNKIKLLSHSKEDEEYHSNKDNYLFLHNKHLNVIKYETLNNIGHYISFGFVNYIFTDYGAIILTAYKIDGEKRHIFESITYVTSDESSKEKIEDLLNSNAVFIKKERKPRIYVTVDNGNYIDKTEIDYNIIDCDIKTNYNDDLPYERINQLLNSNKQELILLHGEPGSGKTTLIKKLTLDNIDKEFIFFDYNLFSSCSNVTLFKFLTKNKNSIFIIEDCEKLFVDRNTNNVFLNTMLNLTDGIIGDAFKIKFLCTFNCPPSKIDKAVLREGRLSLIYEFKKLTMEKTKALLKTADEPKTLAQIYCEKNGYNANKKVGF